MTLCPYVSNSVAFMLNAAFFNIQVFQTESTFLIHHANAFEDGEEIEVTIINYPILALISRCIHHFLTRNILLYPAPTANSHRKLSRLLIQPESHRLLIH